MDGIGGDVCEVAVERGADTGDEDVIPHLEAWLVIELERDHAPVHDVGAVALRGVLARDVGKAADDALAARRLLARTAVTGLDGIDHAAELGCLGVRVET